jgi:hypothetical protein
MNKESKENFDSIINEMGITLTDIPIGRKDFEYSMCKRKKEVSELFEITMKKELKNLNEEDIKKTVNCCNSKKCMEILKEMYYEFDENRIKCSIMMKIEL